MFLFHEVELSDIHVIKTIFKNATSQSCDATFGNLFLWQIPNTQRVCICEDTLFLRYGEETPYYLFPVGTMPTETAINLLLEDAKERKTPFEMRLVTEKECEILEKLFPNRFIFEYDRDNSDYIYNSQDLITLAGKKYHSKRNHITKFDCKHAWSYEPMSEENLEGCRRMNDRWNRESGIENDVGLQTEKIAMDSAFDNFEELGLVGGVLRVDDEVAAFGIGEPIGEDTFCVHFEKALSAYEGAYSKINQLFAQNACADYPYINREEDMGIEGLRRAKSSYHPAFLLKKYKVTLR